MKPTDTPEYQRFRRYYQRIGPFLSKQRNNQSTAAIFSLLAVSLFGWYAIRPTVQTILFLKREIADKTTVNQKMEEKITSLIEAQAAYEAVSDKLPLVDEAIPPTSQAVELTRQLKGLASQTGASVSAIQVQSVPLTRDATPSAKTQPDTEGNNVSLTVVLSGSWASVHSFLEGIVDLRRVTTVELISLKPDLGGPGGISAPILHLVLKLTSYYEVN